MQILETGSKRKLPAIKSMTPLAHLMFLHPDCELMSFDPVRTAATFSKSSLRPAAPPIRFAWLGPGAAMARQLEVVARRDPP
jgi:hypothetical protein